VKVAAAGSQFYFDCKLFANWEGNPKHTRPSKSQKPICFLHKMLLRSCSACMLALRSQVAVSAWMVWAVSFVSCMETNFNRDKGLVCVWQRLRYIHHLNWVANLQCQLLILHASRGRSPWGDTGHTPPTPTEIRHTATITEIQYCTVGL